MNASSWNSPVTSARIAAGPAVRVRNVSMEFSPGMRAKIPQGRFGQLDDLLGAALYLASDASAYVTGQCLTVDGGYLASI